MTRVILAVLGVIILTVILVISGCSYDSQSITPTPQDSESTTPTVQDSKPVTTTPRNSESITPTPKDPEPEQAPIRGKTAPDIELKNLDGETVTLRSFRGRPIMLNFWATWCGPCRIEIPVFEEVYNDPEWAGHGLEILAIDVQESTSQVRQFMEVYTMSFPVFLDSRAMAARIYNIAAFPTTFFIDKDGIIREIRIGAFTTKASVERMLANSIIEVD